VERATGIEPTRGAPPELENKRFGARADPKCDWRVNFRGIWGHVGLRRNTSVGEIRSIWPSYFRAFDRYDSSKPRSLLVMKGRPAGNKLGILTTCNSTDNSIKRSR
jgi:hypothetical protein